MVDRTVVLRKVSELEIHLGQVSQYADTSIEDYRSDWKIQRIVERTLQMMIETCADIANHIIADSGMRAPVSYADTFKVQQENGILEPELSGGMEKWRSSGTSSSISTKASTPGSSSPSSELTSRTSSSSETPSLLI